MAGGNVAQKFWRKVQAGHCARQAFTKLALDSYPGLRGLPALEWQVQSKFGNSSQDARCGPNLLLVAALASEANVGSYLFGTFAPWDTLWKTLINSHSLDPQHLGGPASIDSH